MQNCYGKTLAKTMSVSQDQLSANKHGAGARCAGNTTEDFISDLWKCQEGTNPSLLPSAI